ncbi:type IV pilin [Methanosarcina sp. KYL-1]|uniref:type IV pilin N-terminal domain-containing protein n=1 Tax=Methanosarcina sp. KYL-1 TaxID=2602068 RepID=UPI0021015ACC|nr:type IV pilin N-terminal domain-containing protein [Methanosarcina sp. KYL-1]MCQ1534711.1 type IV pilin [Methanosarcina sp. KYL-1]
MNKNGNLQYFSRDSRAVSEVMGEILLVAIVVILLSSVAAVVYGELGVTDVPHVEIHERVNTTYNRIKIEHAGGEPLKLDSIKITLYRNGEKYDFLPSDPDVTCSSDNGAWKFGDTIVIDTDQVRSIKMEENDTVDLFFIHTPSRQVLHKVRLSDAWKR